MHTFASKDAVTVPGVVVMARASGSYPRASLSVDDHVRIRLNMIAACVDAARAAAGANDAPSGSEYTCELGPDGKWSGVAVITRLVASDDEDEGSRQATVCVTSVGRDERAQVMGELLGKLMEVGS